MGSVCMSTRTAYTDSFGSGALAPQCDGEYTLIYEKLCLFQDSTDPGSVTVRVRIQAAEVLHGNRADPQGLGNPSFYYVSNADSPSREPNLNIVGSSCALSLKSFKQPAQDNIKMPQNNYRNVIVEVKGQIGILYVRNHSMTTAPC